MSISQMISFIFIFGIKYFIMEQNIIKGMSTSPVYEEGDCYSLVNMRHKQGALIPVPKRNIERELDRKYDLLFIHQINELERLIGVVVTNDKSVIYYIKADDSTIISEVDDVIVGIEQTGYILSFVAKKDIYYAKASKIDSDESYLFLGNVPELPKVEFFSHRAVFRTVELSNFGLSDGLNADNYFERVQAGLFRVKDLNEGANNGRRVGFSLFYDFFWVKVAYRLYDGSVVKSSAPVLIATPYNYNNALQALHNGGDMGTRNRVRLAGFQVRGYLKKEELEIDPKWKDIIISMDVFVSKPLGLCSIESIDTKKKKTTNIVGPASSSIFYMGNFMKLPSAPRKLIMDNSNLYLLREIDLFSNKDFEKDKEIEIPEFKEQYFFELLTPGEVYKKYKDIVMQEELTSLGLDVHRVGANVSYLYNKRLHIADTVTTLYSGYGLEGFTNRFIKDGKRVNSYPTDDGDSIVIDKDLKFYYDRNSDELKWDEFPIGYNGIVPIEPNNPKDLYDVPFKVADIESVVIKVSIDFGMGLESVYTVTKKEDMFYWGLVFSNAVVSYPDLRAKRMTIMYTLSNSESVYEVLNVNLAPHDSMGMSYFMQSYFDDVNLDKLKEDELVDFIGANKGIAPIAKYRNFRVYEKTKTELLKDLENYKESGVVVRELNKMKVSEVDNPMAFSNASTYQVSNGTILNIATNAMRVSEGQFGQYPLYVFTTKGIYAMNVGGAEAVYTTVHAPVSFDIPIAKHLCSTNNGVAFVSERGIKFITGGQQVDLLTSAIETSNIDMNLELPIGLDKQFLIIQDKEDFLDTLYKIDALAFDAVENEIVVSVRDTDFNYVINLSNGTLWLSEENFHTVVKNSYPNLLVANNTDLINYKDKATNMANVNFQLRPLAFGASGIKQLPRAILRGTFNVAKDFCFGCMSSQDNENFQNVRIGIAKPGSYASLDYGLMMANKANMYSYFGSGWLLDTTRIIKIDSIVYREFDSDKMR